MLLQPAFSFIHCADLHLDSPFEGLEEVAPSIADALRQATFQALDHVVEVAIHHEVDFVVIAGDLYDGADRSLRAQVRLRASLERLTGAGIQVFIAHGNHDFLDSWSAALSLPEGVHRFGAGEVDGHLVYRGDEAIAQVFGRSYRRREERDNLALGFPPHPGPPFAIAVLHGNVGGRPEHDAYAPCRLEELLARGYDYWALGHVHQHLVLCQHPSWVVYPGNTQGRSVRETGWRGACLVRVSAGGSVELAPFETAAVRWEVVDLDLTRVESGMQGAEPVEALLSILEEGRERARIAADGRPVVWRARLRGRSEFHALLHRPQVRAQLAEALREGETLRRDFAWLESLEVLTRPAVDLAARRLGGDFLGEFLRQVEALRRRPDAPAEVLQRLLPLPEARHVRHLLDELSETELLALLDEAETLAVDQLRS